MKITILGGAGFIGSSLVQRLMVGGHSLRVYEHPNENKKEQYEALGIMWIDSKSNSFEDIENAIMGSEAVIHLASNTLPHSSNFEPILDIENNVISSIRLLKAMVKHKIPKLIFISSGGTVYGNPHYLPIDERHPTDPITSYAIAKLAIEKYALMYEKLYGLRTIILRVSNPYGPLQRSTGMQGAIRIFIDRVLKNQNIEIWGDGNTIRDYIYIDDLVEAINKSLLYSGNMNVFNIGTGIGTSLNEILHLIGLNLGKVIHPIYDTKRQSDVPSNILNIALAQKELQWNPSVNITKGIAKMIAHIENYKK